MKKWVLSIPISLLLCFGLFVVSSSAESISDYSQWFISVLDPVPCYPLGLLYDEDTSNLLNGQRMYFASHNYITDVSYTLPGRVRWSCTRTDIPGVGAKVSYDFQIDRLGGDSRIALLLPAYCSGAAQVVTQWSIDGLTLEYVDSYVGSIGNYEDTVFDWAWYSFNGSRSVINDPLPDGYYSYVCLVYDVVCVSALTDSINFTIDIYAGLNGSHYQVDYPVDLGTPSVGGFLSNLSDFFSAFSGIFNNQVVSSILIVVGSAMVVGIFFKLVL